MSSIKSNFIYSCIYQIANILVPLITTPYLSRTLGADGVGTYSYSFSIAHIFAIFILLGLNNYGNREIAAVRDDKKLLGHTFWSIYCMQVLMGLLVGASYVLYCIFVPSKKLAAIILGLYVFSTAFDVNWFYFGIEKFRFISIRNVMIKVASAIAIFIFVKSSEDVFRYCLIMGIGFVVTQLSLWPYIFKKIKPTVITKKDIIKHLKPNFVLFITVIAVNIYKYMDKIMLGAMSSYEQVGYYELSEKVIIIPTALITALGAVMLPRASYLVSKGGDGNNLLMEKSIIFASFFSASISFGLMGISKNFIPLFYGKGYEECVFLFIAILPSSIFLAFANVIRTQYLLPHNMDKHYVISAIIGAIVNVTINALLIPKYGAIGAALGTTVAEFVVCTYQTNAVRRYIKVGKMIDNAIPYILSGLCMFITIYFIDLDMLDIVVLLLKVIFGIIIYFLSLTIFLKIRKRNVREIMDVFLSKNN